MKLILHPEGITVTDLSSYSEFSNGGYDLPAVCKAVNAVLKISDDIYPDEIVRQFNRIYWKHASFIEREILKQSHMQYLRLSRTIEPDNDEEIFEEDEALQKLVDLYNQLCTDVLNSKNIFQEMTEKKYLDAFFDVSREVVFSPGSYNLGNNLFRESRLLKRLLSFAAEEKSVNIENPAALRSKINLYNFSLLDPFAYDTTGRIIKCLKKLVKQSVEIQNRDGELLKQLRWEIFSNSVQSAYKRHISFDKRSYRIDMNRHTSKLTAYPANELSSTEEIKPIRLFGKTAAYIRNHLIPGKKLCRIHLCMIGHTEKSRNDKEASLTDYVSAVLNWYDMLPQYLESASNLGEGEGRKPDLKLIITNYINDADGSEYNYKDRRTSFSLVAGNNSEHTAECQIVRTSYEDVFSFGMDGLKYVIDRNDLIFLLDCPWLSTENYRIRESGDLKYYCHELQQTRRDYPDIERFFAQDISAFYQRSTMNKLAVQYNRIMGTRSSNSGELVRSMRDKFIREIQSYLMSYTRDLGSRLFSRKDSATVSDHSKELYIFSSENDGIDYSFISRYPLTRDERYDGKRFTIIQFTQGNGSLLPLKHDGGPQYVFDLWSVLKYISISYAYRNFMEEIRPIVGLSDEEPIYYFEVLRNILIHFSLTEDLEDIRISIGFGENLEKILKKMNQDNYSEEIKDALWNLSMDLIRPLYTNGVFASNRYYGDDAIKKGFLMNLYGAVKDVQSMLFYHRYKMAMRNDSFASFHLSFDTWRNEQVKAMMKDSFRNRDFFMDKKLYSVVMANLEFSIKEPLGASSMFKDAEAIFGKQIRKKHGNVDARTYYLRNIWEACRLTAYDDSELFHNAQEALEIMRIP